MKDIATSPAVLDLGGDLYVFLDQVLFIESHRGGFIVRFVNGSRRLVVGRQAESLRTALRELNPQAGAKLAA